MYKLNIIISNLNFLIIIKDIEIDLMELNFVILFIFFRQLNLYSYIEDQLV
jgi:hypothetical protein